MDHREEPETRRAFGARDLLAIVGVAQDGGLMSIENGTVSRETEARLRIYKEIGRDVDVVLQLPAGR